MTTALMLRKIRIFDKKVVGHLARLEHGVRVAVNKPGTFERCNFNMFLSNSKAASHATFRSRDTAHETPTQGQPFCSPSPTPQPTTTTPQPTITPAQMSRILKLQF